MKRSIILLFVLAVIASLNATTYIVEDVNSDVLVSQGETELTAAEIVINIEGEDIVPVLITFNVQMDGYCDEDQVGLKSDAKVGLVVDGDIETLNSHSIRLFGVKVSSTVINRYFLQDNQSVGFWQMFLEPGEHTINLNVSGGIKDIVEFSNAVLQVRYDVSDETAVCEQPDDNDNEPLPRSLIATSNSLILPGAVAVYDKTGREVDGVIQGDKIVMDALPMGQYFIKTNTASGHTVKVVKTK